MRQMNDIWSYITITNPAGDGGYFVPYDFYLELVELKLLPPGWGIETMEDMAK